MKNAGQTFVRAIQIILKPLKEFADSYVDDSAVLSNTWRHHLTHIEEFLKTMRSEGLTKLSVQVSENQIRIYKVTAIKEMSEPSTKRQLLFVF